MRKGLLWVAVALAAAGLWPRAGRALTNAELRAVSVFAEAEDFTLPKTWRAVPGLGIDMYPAVSGGSSIHTAGEGTATLAVTIPKDGDYTLWLFAAKWVYDRSLVLRVEQNGKIAGESTFIRPEDKYANWTTFAQRGQQPAPLKAGPAKLILYGPPFGGYVGAPVDAVLLTADATYTAPNWRDFSPLCQVRFTVLTPAAPPATLATTALAHKDPYYRYGPEIAGTDGKPVAPNTPSAWGEISPLLASGDAVSTVNLRLKSDKPLPSRWTLRLEFKAKKPAGGEYARTIEEEWDGDTAAYEIPGDLGRYYEKAPIASITAISRRHFEEYGKFAFPGGPGDIRAKKLILETDVYSVSPRLFALEMQTVAHLGINSMKLYGKAYQDAAAAGKMRFDTALSQCFIHDAGLTSCSFDPELKVKLEKQLTDWADNMRKNDPVQFRNVRYVILADEPGTPNGLTHMTTCPRCQAAFRDWLRARGKAPADFGLADWEAVKPLVPRKEDGAAPRRLGWLASQFAQETAPLPYKFATDCLQQAFGRPVGTRVNFSDECMSGFGNTMSNGNGFNWFEFGRLGATTLPWSEDFTYQNQYITSFLVDVLRSTETTKRQPLGMYHIWGFGPPADPHNAELRAMTSAARGVKVLNYYWYGPFYAATECAGSEDAVYQQSMGYGNRVLALADDLLGPAMPPDRKVAILWSQATEQWPTDNLASIERRMLHHALAMQQAPAEFLCEKDLATRLKEYAVLYLPASHLAADCLPALTAWVEAGGTLVVVGGGPERNEIDEPWDGLRALQGLTGVTVRRDAAWYRSEDPMKASDEATLEGLKAPVGVAGLRSILLPATGTTVTGRYKGGEAAVTERQAGKGRVVTYGFLPGTSLLTAIDPEAITKRRFWKPAAEAYYRAVALPVAQAGVRPPVSTAIGVDAARLDGPAGSVVTLANFTGAPLGKLAVRIRGTEKYRRIVSAIGSPVTVTRDKEGITVTLPLKTVDVIKMYK